MKQELIHSIWSQWKVAKSCAEDECRKRNLSNLASKFKMCEMFKGDENFEQIVSLYKSTKGMEFCMRYHFPSIETLRLFKTDSPERYGIYIDAGNIEIDNPKGKVVLIGNTIAKITCNRTVRYQIVLLHEATAIINASGWAVVAPEYEKGCSLIKNVKDNAIIL